MLDAVLAVRKRVQVRSPDADRGRPECESLQNVGSTLDTTVHVDLELREHFGTLLVDLK